MAGLEVSKKNQDCTAITYQENKLQAITFTATILVYSIGIGLKWSTVNV